MSGYENLYGQIDFEPLINTAYAVILIQAIQESVRAAKIAKLEDKKARLERNIKFYQAKLEQNYEINERCLKQITAAETKIATGTAKEITYLNLQTSRENLSLVTARKHELDTQLANAEKNLAKANKRIENLRAESALITARETQRFHCVFFPQACMPQKGKMLTYSLGFTKR